MAWFGREGPGYLPQETKQAGLDPPTTIGGDVVVLLLLLLVAILFGLGFVVKWLFILAAVLFVLWLAGWLVRPGGARWYYW